MERKTVVVVEDEPDIAALLRVILEEGGYRVLSAPDGREGIETVLDAKPDLVLMDVLLPMVQGGEAIRYLKGQQGLENTKIVLMSSLAPADFDLIFANRPHADGYLHKPLSPGLVLETVGALISKT